MPDPFFILEEKIDEITEVQTISAMYACSGKHLWVVIMQ